MPRGVYPATAPNPFMKWRGSKFVHMMPSQWKMSINQTIEMNLAYESRLKLKESYQLMGKQVGGYDILGFTKQDHRSYLQKKRVARLERYLVIN